MKIPSKNLGRKCCAERFISGVKGFIWKYCRLRLEARPVGITVVTKVEIPGIKALRENTLIIIIIITIMQTFSTKFRTNSTQEL
jgi:hypothetical protein